MWRKDDVEVGGRRKEESQMGSLRIRRLVSWPVVRMAQAGWEPVVGAASSFVRLPNPDPNPNPNPPSPSPPAEPLA